MISATIWGFSAFVFMYLDLGLWQVENYMEINDKAVQEEPQTQNIAYQWHQDIPNLCWIHVLLLL